MNEIQLLKTDDGTPVIDSITIAEGVKVQHKNVLELIKKYLEDFQAFNPIAFETRKGKALPQGGFAKPTEIALLNEDQAMVLFTFLKNTPEARAIKVKIVKAFKACRDALSEVMKSYKVPQTRAEALRLAADLSDRVDQLETQIKQDAPKVSFAEAVAASDTELSLTETAKTLSIKPTVFNDWLRQHGFLYKQSTQAMQISIDRGLMVVRFAHYSDSEGNEKLRPYARVTAKGLEYFYHRLVNDGLIQKNDQLELSFA